MSKILIICPVFNEAHHLETLIKEFQNTRFNGELLFVNSGSEDKSLSIIKKSNYKYINLKKNYGVGNAIVKGINYGLENDYEIVCIISGNGKMRPKFIDELTNPIINNVAHFVQGSRYIIFKNKNMPFFRKLIIPLITKIFSLLFNYKFTDATCGYRAFHLDLIKCCTFNINAKWLRKYAFEPYLFSNVILDKNVRKVEVSVTMDYPMTKVKYTKIKPVIDYPSLFFPYLFALIYPRKFNDLISI
jgi:dolichol-phosphate mannosyltransferase